MNEFLYKCEQCPRTFKLEEFYEKHKKVHELKKQHRCDVCGFVYGAAKGLDGHMKTHSEAELTVTAVAKASIAAAEAQKPPLDLNNFRFLSKQGVLTSVAPPPSLPQQPSFLAAAAGSILTQQQAPPLPAVRREKMGSIEMMEPLPVMPLSLSQLEDRSGVAPSPNGSGNYVVYDSVPEINDAAVHPNGAGFFVCSICCREFTGLNSLKKHTPIHTRKVQHKCDVCGFVFGKKDYLLDHLRVHSGDMSPKCEVCAQTFNKSLKLKEHMKTHTNFRADGSVMKECPFRCHVCKEPFQVPKTLGQHLLTAHPNTDSVYKCDKCDATFGDVRGKNHHMYNEHQLNTFSDKCVWCPVCNQGFTRPYNLKVHMQKSHGKEYVDNNFTPEQIASMTKTIPGVTTPPTAASLVKSEPSKDAIELLKQVQLQSQHVAGGQIGHYFDLSKNSQMLSCSSCPQRFIRKSDLLIHLEQDHGQKCVGCTLCGEKFLEIGDLREHITEAHAADTNEPPAVAIRPKTLPYNKPGPASRKRKPGPASRTNAPAERRGSNTPPVQYDEAEQQPMEQAISEFKCPDCGKILDNKQSFLSHMKLMHNTFYGGNKWKGSQVVEKILEESNKLSPKKRGTSCNRSGPEANATMCSVCEQVFPNPSSLRNHVVNVHINGQNFTCDLCGKAFLSSANLETHIKSKHPNLNKRLQNLRDALGLTSQDEYDSGPDAKRPRLPYNTATSLSPSGILPKILPPKIEGLKLDLNQNVPSSLPSDSVLSTLKSLNPAPLDLSVTSTLTHVLSSSVPLSPNSRPIIIDFPTSALKVINLSNNNNNVNCPDANNNNGPPAITDKDSTSIKKDDLSTIINEKKAEAAPSGAPIIIPDDSAPTGGRKKNSVCKVCGVVLSPKTNVNVHMRTHSGARPYQCVLCLNKFRQKAHLMKHFRCSHNQKRPPFICLYCPDELPSSNDLYRHIADQHQKETDEHVRVNGIVAPPDDDPEEEVTIEQEQQLQPEPLQLPQQPVPPTQLIQLPQHPEPPLVQLPLTPVPQSQQHQLLQQQKLPLAPPSPQQHEQEAQTSTEIAEAAADEDVRYEAITEAFLFEQQIIFPCYVVLPFVTDKEVEACTEKPNEEFDIEVVEDEEDEAELQIDEGSSSENTTESERVDDDEEESSNNSMMGSSSSGAIKPVSMDIDPELLSLRPVQPHQLGLGLQPLSLAQRKADDDDESKKENASPVLLTPPALPLSSSMRVDSPPLPAPKNYNAEDIKSPGGAGFYPPPFGADFALPFTLSSIWKKKVDVLPPETLHQLEMIQKMEEIKELNASVSEKVKANATTPKSSSKPSNKGSPSPKTHMTNSGNRKQVENATPGSTTEVTNYENDIQNDHWPLDCIKCKVSLGNLESFNQHMNDHWSDDKCCPVCGLLINSKRFNFKQHLKIHTGEKPFSCKICSRSFRQKAHMVKHITTHRTMPNGQQSVVV